MKKDWMIRSPSWSYLPPPMPWRNKSLRTSRAYIVVSNATAIAGQVLEEVYGKTPYQTRVGGSIPVMSTLLDQLGVHAVMYSFGHDDENQHAPDEFFRLPTFRLGQTAYVRLMERLAG